MLVCLHFAVQMEHIWNHSFILSFAVLYFISSYSNGHLHHVHRGERIEDGWQSNHYKNGEHNDHFDHEAVLGSKSKSKEFDSLTPEESKQRLKVLVSSKIDANHDDQIDKEELVNWLLQSFKSLAEEDGRERMEEEDTNKDEFVTWDEHLKDTFDIDESTDEDIYLRDEVMKEDKELWMAADINKDGKLDVNEFSAFNSPEDYEFMHETLYQQLMAKRDKNKDGYLSLIEFTSDIHGEAPDFKSEQFLDEKDKFENDYDIDKDGRLNRKEIINWIIPDSRSVE